MVMKMGYMKVRYDDPDEETGRSDAWHPIQKVQLLQPTVAVADAGITPVVVWGEHALAFVHEIPTYVFDLKLLVPDDQVRQAADAILAAFDYEDIPREGGVSRPPSCSFDSAFHFNPSPPASNPATTLTRPELELLPEGVVFPTRPAFINSILDILLDDPEDGYYHYFYHSELFTFLNYLVGYYAKEITEDPKGFLESLNPREDNALYMKKYIEFKLKETKTPEFKAERARIQTRLGIRPRGSGGSQQVRTFSTSTACSTFDRDVNRAISSANRFNQDIHSDIPLTLQSGSYVLSSSMMRQPIQSSSASPSVTSDVTRRLILGVARYARKI